MKKVVALLLGLNVLAVSIFNSINTVNSDTVWPYLLFPHFFKNMVYLGPDTFILHYPISYLLARFNGINITTVFVDTGILVFATITGWLIYYFYFLKKYLHAMKIIYFLPAFLFVNFTLPFYQMISIPSERNIEFSAALLLSIYFDNYLLVKSKKLLKLGVFLAMLLLFISDPYFIYVFAIPLLIILFIKSFINSKYKNVTTLMLITIVADTIVRYLINKTGFFTLYGVSNAHLVSPHRIFQNIDLTIKSLLYIFGSYQNFNILSFLNLSFLLLGIYGLWLMFKKGIVTLPLCFLFTILAYVLSGQPTDLQTYRYLIFIVFIIPPAICYVISKFSSKYIRTSITIGLIVLSLANFIQMFSTFDSRNIAGQYEKNLLIIKTVQENGLNYGYTSYWNAGINTFLSGSTTQLIQVACVNHQIKAFKWLAAQSWFDSNSYHGKTFLMIDYGGSLTPEIESCNLTDITKQFGKPAKTVAIPYPNENLSLIIFDYDIAKKF